MRTILKSLTIVTAIAAAPIPAISTEGTDMTNAEKEALAAVEGMTAAFCNKNIDRVMQSYEDTLNVAFERGKAEGDAAQIKAWFEDAFAVDPVFEYSGHEVYVAGDLAVHIAPWTMTGRTPDGHDIADNGLSVAVLRRQPGGEWLIVIDNPYGARLLEEK